MRCHGWQLTSLMQLSLQATFCALAQCSHLDGTQLTGTLPAAWTALRSLRYMYVLTCQPRRNMMRQRFRLGFQL
jgi:hypothetical protein